MTGYAVDADLWSLRAPKNISIFCAKTSKEGSGDASDFSSPAQSSPVFSNKKKFKKKQKKFNFFSFSCFALRLRGNYKKRRPIMAKVTLPSYIKDGRGRMEDAVMFQWKGQTYMRHYKKRENITEKQQEVRNAFSTLANDWKCLRGAVQSSWKMYVEGERMLGLNAFIGENVPRRRSGMPIVISKGFGERPLENFTVEAGTNAGEIHCTFDSPAEGSHVTVFVSKQAEEGKHFEMTRHDLGADPSVPCPIAGLESGADYHVYAIVTNAAYEDAETLSESVSGEITVV